MIRLGHATFSTGRLSPEAIDGGRRGGQRLVRIARSAGRGSVRAVATCAVREAENAAEFVEAVAARCGVDVDVISGDEEARLITLASEASFPPSCDPLLLIDIGGGSTELVVSDGNRVLFAESLAIGVVRLSEKFVRTIQSPGKSGRT